MPLNKRIVTAFTVILIFLTGCVHFSDQEPLTSISSSPNKLIINNVNIVTGKASDNITKKSLLIENGYITNITDKPISASDAHIINADNKYLMPGIIDFHTHITASGAPPWRTTIGNPETNLSAYLAAGVTSVVDMGGPLQDLKKWSDKQQNSEYPYPGLVYAGNIFTVPHGHPHYLIKKSSPWPLSWLARQLIISSPESYEELDALIEEHHKAGSKFIKVVIDEIPIDSPQLSKEQLSHIVKKAKSLNLTTVAHVGTEVELIKGIESGIKIFVHSPYRSALSDANLKTVIASGATIIPTNVVFDNIANLYQRQLEFSPFEKSIADPVLINAYNNRPENIEIDAKIDAWFKQVVQFKQQKIDHVSKFKKAGVNLVAGSDSPNVATFPGTSIHKELALWVEKGDLSPKEALETATYAAGKLLYKVNGRKVGHIAIGYEADLVLLEKNPIEDIRATETINTVILRGKIIDRHI